MYLHFGPDLTLCSLTSIYLMRYSLHEIDKHHVVATTVAADRNEALGRFSEKLRPAVRGTIVVFALVCVGFPVPQKEFAVLSIKFPVLLSREFRHQSIEIAGAKHAPWARNR